MHRLVYIDVATAGGVQEMELNAQTKHCLPKSEKKVWTSNIW